MGTHSTASESVVTARLVNAHEVPITFYLEPWGEAYAMPPGAVFEVVARGPHGDGLEVAFAADQITVWAWPGSVVSLSHAGTELGAGNWGRSPVPAMPPVETTPSALADVAAQTRGAGRRRSGIP
jgi:hypothetical protein